MQDTDLPEFLTLLTSLGSVYGKSITAVWIEVYWQALQRFEFSAVKAALLAHVENPDTGQFMPKPADIVRALEGSRETRALQAWSQVLKGVRTVGCYRSVVFDDALIHRVVEDMGGWVLLCKMSEDALPFRAQEFSKRYAALLGQAPPRHSKLLVGLFEFENRKTSHGSDPPVFLGDVKKAQAIYQGNMQHPVRVKSSTAAAVCCESNDDVEKERV